jgi:hypothetical protein
MSWYYVFLRIGRGIRDLSKKNAFLKQKLALTVLGFKLHLIYNSFIFWLLFKLKTNEQKNITVTSFEYQS